MSLFDRDYDQDLTLTMTWGEWNEIHSLVMDGIEGREGEWPDEHVTEIKEIRKKLTAELQEESPGNGMDDWPEDMKKAYSEAVREMSEDIE